MSKIYKLIEETARQKGLLSHVQQSMTRQSLTFMVVEQAMHAYAEKTAVEFAEFTSQNDWLYIDYLGVWHCVSKNENMLPADLYKLFTQQNQK